MNIDKDKLNYLLVDFERDIIDLINDVLLNDEDDPHASATAVERRVKCYKSVSQYFNRTINFTDVQSFMQERGYSDEDFATVEKFKEREQRNFPNCRVPEIYDNPNLESVIQEIAKDAVRIMDDRVWNLCNQITDNTNKKCELSAVEISNVTKCLVHFANSFDITVAFSDVESYLSQGTWYTARDKRKFNRLLKKDLKKYTGTVF